MCEENEDEKQKSDGEELSKLINELAEEAKKYQENMDAIENAVYVIRKVRRSVGAFGDCVENTPVEAVFNRQIAEYKKQKLQEQAPRPFNYETSYKIEKIPLSQYDIPKEVLNTIEQHNESVLTNKHPIVGQRVLNKEEKRPGKVKKVLLKENTVEKLIVESEHTDATWELEPEKFEKIA